IVVSGRCAVRIRSTDRDDIRAVAGRVDLPVHLVSVTVFADVSGGSNYDDTVAYELFNFQTDRVVRVAVDRVTAEAKVDNTDVVRRFILQYPIESIEQPGRLSLAAVIKDFDANNVRVFSNSAVGPAVA